MDALMQSSAAENAVAAADIIRKDKKSKKCDCDFLWDSIKCEAFCRKSKSEEERAGHIL